MRLRIDLGFHMFLFAFLIPSFKEIVIFLFATAMPVMFTLGLIRFVKKRAGEDLDAHPAVVKVATPEEDQPGS